MHIDESIYRVRLFQTRSYNRLECKYCKAKFWSRRYREDCGDAPCTEYTFFDIPVKRSLSYREVRDLFLEFFRKREHEVIEPKPVVARWREDLYLTIASIVVFQPHVTSGIVPPPANPLVIAQPCIRLEDIDNVGLTFGRHLTNFIMGGHHAFNYPDKYVYWTDETVEYAKELFVEEIGIPEEELTFKESWWEGGGNAGPCFEVAVGGLELATLVFMMYRVEDGKYVEIPMKIVDTGYGIERIAWFTQKTPTAFHAVYGPLVSEFHKVLGVPEPDKEILYTGARIVSKLRPSEPNAFEWFINAIADRLGIDRREVEQQLRPTIDLYALLDHTKTIALMLADGIVPSNSGEGYLARLVIRRALRRLHRLARDVPLRDLVVRQLSYWHDMYPQMYRNRERILEMLELEEEKFRDVIKRLSTIASKFVKKKPTLDDLVLLYDSQGIPPDMLRDELERRFGVSIDIPPNFYSIVASRHSRPPVVRELEKKKLSQDVISWASRFPETRRLFHEDPYLRTFRARVLGVYENYLVLDATAFYPEGGGQLGDQGYIYVNGKKIRVVDTQKSDGVVIHILETSDHGIKEGQEVVGEIDWSIRYRRMRHHTATHILLGALRRVLGEHVWQAGAEKTEHKARLDVTHYRLPSPEEIAKIEDLANKIVDEALPVKVHYLPKNDAEKMYGFTLYQGGVPLLPVIRVVEIPHWDAEACFGTHVKNTSEVGGLKIINVEKIADGVVRFEFTIATALVDYTRNLEGLLTSVSRKLGASVKELDRRVDTLLRELNTYRAIVRDYRNLYLDTIVNDILSNAKRLDNLKLYIYTHRLNDREILRDILVESIKREPSLILIALVPQNNNTYVEISLGSKARESIDARSLARELMKTIPLKAGGKPDHVTGIANLDIDEVREAIEKSLPEILRIKQN